MIRQLSFLQALTPIYQKSLKHEKKITGTVKRAGRNGRAKGREGVLRTAKNRQGGESGETILRRLVMHVE